MAGKLRLINKFRLPYKQKAINVIKKSMLDSYRYGRNNAKSVVRKSKKLGKKLKAEFATVQEFIDEKPFMPTGEELSRFKMPDNPFEDIDSNMISLLIATAQEMAENETVYAKVAVVYSEWAEKLGTDLWERKVSAVRDITVKGIEEGWGLRPVGHYEAAKGVKVSAYEATGGKGGAVNVLSGYKYIQDKPGVLNEMGKKLEPFGYQGWQIERLARTEFTRAMNDGLMAVYQDDDSLSAYAWSAILDKGTCIECAMMDGVIFEIGDPRLSYYSPPIHPQCRCLLDPIFSWEMQEANFDKERSVTLYNKQGNPFELTYVPSSINPDFLKPIRPSNDAVAVKRQLLTKKESEVFRDGFVPTDPKKLFEAWMNK